MPHPAQQLPYMCVPPLPAATMASHLAAAACGGPAGARGVTLK